MPKLLRIRVKGQGSAASGLVVLAPGQNHAQGRREGSIRGQIRNLHVGFAVVSGSAIQIEPGALADPGSPVVSDQLAKVIEFHNDPS